MFAGKNNLTFVRMEYTSTILSCYLLRHMSEGNILQSRVGDTQTDGQIKVQSGLWWIGSRGTAVVFKAILIQKESADQYGIKCNQNYSARLDSLQIF